MKPEDLPEGLRLCRDMFRMNDQGDYCIIANVKDARGVVHEIELCNHHLKYLDSARLWLGKD